MKDQLEFKRQLKDWVVATGKRQQQLLPFTACFDLGIVTHNTEMAAHTWFRTLQKPPTRSEGTNNLYCVLGVFYIHDVVTKEDILGFLNCYRIEEPLEDIWRRIEEGKACGLRLLSTKPAPQTAQIEGPSRRLFSARWFALINKGLSPVFFSAILILTVGTSLAILSAPSPLTPLINSTVIVIIFPLVFAVNAVFYFSIVLLLRGLLNRLLIADNGASLLPQANTTARTDTHINATRSFSHRKPEGSHEYNDSLEGSDDAVLFMSYSHLDGAAMEKVRDVLSTAGFHVWIDIHLEPGTEVWQREVEAAIELSKAFIVILSSNAKQSKWVREELTYAAVYDVPIFCVLAAGDDKSAVPLGLTNNHRVDIRREEDFHREMQVLVGAIRRRLGLEKPVTTRKRSTQHTQAP